MQIVSPKPFWSLHSHSRFSAKDALSPVQEMVARAVELDYPALALTDHGSVSGVVQLYKAARKAGIEPLPGAELYVVPSYAGARSTSMHMGMVAYTPAGYRNLVTVNNIAARNFHYKPVIDFGDFAALAEAGRTAGLAVTTGCWFGVLPTLLRTQEDDRGALSVLRALMSWFPKVYVELQAHGIDQEGPLSEADMVACLIDLAEQAGCPYVIGQDSHYTYPVERPVHDALKTLVSWSDSPDDAKFPGSGGYHMVDGAMLAFSGLWKPAVLERAIDNLHELAEASCVRIPELEHFTLKVPDVTTTGKPDFELECLVWEAAHAKAIDVPARGRRGARRASVLELPEYVERVMAELAVIRTAGMAGLILLARKIVHDYILAKGIWFHARGSASSSMVCWLLGITQVDPIRWGLLFERFLSPDRTRPPDIDLDIERDRRVEVGTELERNYTTRRVGNITTFSLADPEDDPEGKGKGSLRVAYFAKRSKQHLPKIDWLQVPLADRRMLSDLADRELISGYGKHASGFVVAPDEAAVANLPMAYIASSKTHITALGMKDVEQLGLVKMDLLGLRKLTALRITCDLLGWPREQYEEIPLDDKPTFRAIADGHVGGLFQLEGKAQMYGLMRLRPRKVGDIIAAQALYRPAAMRSGAVDAYTARKLRQEDVPVMHADIAAATRDTFGVVLYQEQVMALLRTLGMDADELTSMLGAVKSSNSYVAGAREAITTALPRIGVLAKERGWGDDDVSWLVTALNAYADYGFNLAHAVQYGLVAYRMGYLAVHHPLEFWAGTLIAHDDSEKEDQYIRSARIAGVKLWPAHVNTSKITYTPDLENRAIRRGLRTIHGVGPVAAVELAAKAPYTSWDDLGRRCTPRKVTGINQLMTGKEPRACGGVIAALYDADALEGLPLKG